MTTAAVAKAGPAEARAGRFAGTCYVTLEVDSSPSPLPVDYAELDVSDPGGNFCVMAPDLVVGVTISTANSNPLETHPAAGMWSCVAGFAAGALELSVSAADFPDPMTVSTTLLNVGGTIHMALTALPVTFEGVGTLVQDPFDTAACAQGAVGKMTWTGVLTFQA